MPALYTIGFRKKPLKTFIGLLRDAGVDAIVDVRLRNTSQLSGYTKKDDFAYLLREGFGIAYEHRPELAPSAEILDAYRDDGDWPAYERRFGPLMIERQMERVADEVLSRYRRPCLLCSEVTSDKCHRRLVAEYWQTHISDLEVVHL